MDAKRRILAAAERLFAEFGIESVSLRQIAAAADQRNTSAVAYHYGSKDALVEAIYLWRMTAVNARRMARLAGLGPDPDVPELARALVEPLAATLDDPERGDAPRWYLRFIAQTVWLPPFDPTATLRRPEAESLRIVVDGLRLRLPDLPAEVFAERVRLMTMLVVTALADRERRLQEPDCPTHLPDLGVELLIDAAANLMLAPWKGSR